MSDMATQWGVLGFNRDGQLALPGFPEGFGEGLTVQAWVCPRRQGSRWQLLELGGGRDRPALILGSGEEPGSLALQLEDRQAPAAVSAAGVLVEGRWIHVTAMLDAQGQATLYVQGLPVASGPLRSPGTLEFSSCFVGRSERERGFEGELAQLRIWRRILDPRTIASQWRGTHPEGEAGLAAYYPLDTVSEGQVLDASPYQRHARVNGPVESHSSTAPAETAADVPLAAHFSGAGSHLQIPPMTPEDLKAGLVFQAWIRLQGSQGGGYLLEVGNGSKKPALVLRGEKDVLFIEERVRVLVPDFSNPFDIDSNVKTQRICAVPGVFAPDRWVHVSAALDPKQKQCTVYVNGCIAQQCALDTGFFASSQIRTYCYLGRSSSNANATFAGDLAEVRLWRRPLPPEQVTKTWFSRLRGDEAELLACYRLEAIENGLAIDASPRRMHARVWNTMTAQPAEGLPLRSIDRKGQTRVGVQGRLLTDWVPMSAFPTDRKLPEAPEIQQPPTTPWGTSSAPGKLQQTANAAAYGTAQGSLVRCSVYEVVITPLNAADEPVSGGQAELFFDEPVEVLRTDDGGNVWIESWPAHDSRKLPVPDTSRLRLRILAGSKLDCPPVRVRCEGMSVDAWIVARPAESCQQSLQSLNGQEMRSPKDGHAPVFDSDTSQKDANAAAALLSSAALALPLGSGAGSSTKKLSLGPIGDLGKEAWDTVEHGANEALDWAEHTVKHASDLLVQTGEDLDKLMKKAAKATLQVGSEAARKCIRAAKQLAVDAGQGLESGGEPVWGVVQIVGTAVVDGSEKAFRVMVSGMKEALDTLEEIARKVGATLRKIIDFLAMLFQWGRFLENMELIYGVADKQLRQAKGHVGLLKDLGALIGKAVQVPANSSLEKKTVGQWLGVDKVLSLPGMDELNYLVDQMDSAFSSVGISISKSSSKQQSTPSSVDKQGAAATQDRCMKSMPSELFASTQSVLGVPMKVLMGLPAEVWSVSSSTCQPVFDWIESEAAGAADDAVDLMTGRLSVPVLTDLIENVVLGGKTLNMLRLVALVGAIPMTLGASPSGKSTKSTAPDSQLKSTEKSQQDKTDEAIQWMLFAISLVNALLISARAALEQVKGDKVKLAMGVLYGLSGAFALATASTDLALAERLQSAQARDIARLHGILGLAQGVWLGVMAFIREADVEVVDAIFEIVIGCTEMAATIASVALGLEDETELGTLGFRLSTWGLLALQKVFDGVDNSKGSTFGKVAKGLNIATAVLAAAVDIGEAVYTAHGHATS